MLATTTRRALLALVAVAVPVALAKTYISNPTQTQLSWYSHTDCGANPTNECCVLKAYFDNVSAWNDTSLYREQEYGFNVTATCHTRTTYNWIRIRAPGTPNHPYASPAIKIKIQNYDYIIQMRGGAAVAECDWGDGCDICDYTTLGFGVVGLALNGVAMFSPLSVEYTDPFYPTGNLDEEDLDKCDAHPQAAGIYHYHSAPECLNGYTGAAGIFRQYAVGNTACYDHSCSSSYDHEYYDGTGNYARGSGNSITPTGFSAGSSDHPIGIGLDGHIVYGPYNTSGETIGGLDNCNGKTVDGVYRYYATETFPYLMGCYGPGICNATMPNCTTNKPDYFCSETNAPSPSPTMTLAPTYECAAEYGKCGGGSSYSGPTHCCESDNECYRHTSNYAQCRSSCPTGDDDDVWLCATDAPSPAPTTPSPTWACADTSGKCGGGSSYSGPTHCCNDDETCYRKNANYAQCRSSCPTDDDESWLCDTSVSPTTPPTYGPTGPLNPSAAPTDAPTAVPTAEPTLAKTDAATAAPSPAPTSDMASVKASSSMAMNVGSSALDGGGRRRLALATSVQSSFFAAFINSLVSSSAYIKNASQVVNTSSSTIDGETAIEIGFTIKMVLQDYNFSSSSLNHTSFSTMLVSALSSDLISVTNATGNATSPFMTNFATFATDLNFTVEIDQTLTHNRLNTFEIGIQGGPLDFIPGGSGSQSPPPSMAPTANMTDEKDDDGSDDYLDIVQDNLLITAAAILVLLICCCFCCCMCMRRGGDKKKVAPEVEMKPTPK